MAKDIVTKAEILGGEIDVRANFGQTVKVTVSPDPYMGDTEVTPSAETQVLATKKKFVQDDITVNPAPVEGLLATSNGQFTPSDGKVGFSAVTVDVNPDLRPLSVSENGQYSPDGFDGYSSVSVNVQPDYDVNDMAQGTLTELTLDTATKIAQYKFYKDQNLVSITASKVTEIGEQAFFQSKLKDALFPMLKKTGNWTFHSCPMVDPFHTKFPVIEEIGDRAFQGTKFVAIHLPETLTKLVDRGFTDCLQLKTVYFHGVPTSIGSAAFNEWPSPHITDIYVPWSQGEVANAPWGATSATIHYNTVYDSEWNVISST